MTYIEHLKLNLEVAKRSLWSFFWHILHAIIPIKYTSHEYWGVKLGKKGGK